MTEQEKKSLADSAKGKIVGRVMPNAKDSEKSILGWILLYPDNIKRVAPNLDKSDFYDGRNAVVYSTMLQMDSEGKHIDLVTLGTYLAESELLTMAGGPAYIAELMNDIPRLSKIEPHIESVKEKAKLRGIIKSSYDAFQSCYQSGAKVRDIAAKLVKENEAWASGKEGDPNRVLSHTVKDWVKNSQGEFSRLDVRNDLNLVSTKEKHNLSQILTRLEKDGVITRSGRREGHYRRVEADLIPMEWESADTTEIPVEWPLDISEFYLTYKKSINVVAGKKSEGKTLFCLDFARRNVGKMPIHYFTNELGPQGVKVRTAKFKDVPAELWRKINFYERTENWEDCIRPNDINIIDYLEVTTDFWLSAKIIRAIHKKLVDGMALIAIQKKEGATYGVGGEFTTHAAALYLTLDIRRASIVYCKNLRDGHESHDGKMRKLKIVRGCEFVPESDWMWPGADDKPKGKFSF